ncbi:peptidoglycan recognition protein family protein [Changchengzhania lutea]|uniref:peptidoglycan recognition protein family protein n=1 Tax=Changchengzhania lutea TaxID=2049305 RepID=UPI00115EFCD3|nr:peptidoglycan recognition family protein [Changchengzhania lutea]
MKNRAIALIITLMMGTGVTIFNYTGEDVVLESGETVKTGTLPKHLTKAFKKRTLEKPLYITFHHTAGNKNQTVESIAKDQIKRGFAEFAYHFAIYEDGSVYAVNDIEETTWHDSGQNTNSIGVVFVGNYETYLLSKEAYNSANQLSDALCKTFHIIGIRGHRDTSPTLCPGENVYKQLKQKLFY